MDTLDRKYAMSVETFDTSEFNSADDLKGFSHPEAGQYHLVVSEIDESRKMGNAIVVSFGVLAGTVPGQQNKTFREFFNDPHSSHKDGGAFCKKRRLALLLATGVVTPDMIGKQFSVDWQSLFERQLKASVTVEERADKDDATKIRRNAHIEGLEMWGPLDEKAKHIPHDQVCVDAAIRAGQSNVVGLSSAQVGGPAPARTASASPAAASVITPAVDKYANL